ncbi:AraC family transcriptional regulator [Streptomyces hydrogenans]|uniref:AraC family transcriptional regulator n=1 Tax=Streptomyces hydrogenans TaxID=1873719 RepID=UPI0036740810
MVVLDVTARNAVQQRRGRQQDGRGRPRPRRTPLRRRDGTARAGRGEDTLLIGGGFSFGARARELLLDRLPPVIHIPAGTPHAQSVDQTLAVIDQELTHRPMAAGLVAEHLAVVMLVHALRLHLATTPHHSPGRHASLADPLTAAALTALHREPARPWTVAELARAVGYGPESALSFTSKRVMGIAPGDHRRRARETEDEH